MKLFVERLGCSLAHSPVWLVEIGFKENFNDLINPDFSKIFDLFWSHGYVVKTADFQERLIEPADIERWLHKGVRDFGVVNYLFVR